MAAVDTERRILEVLKRYWGFDELRPLQRQAIEAGLARRDSLVVLPTGGGKSLCYQVPPMICGEPCVVISPLIALMKDQEDGLRQVGYPAAALHSGMEAQERRDTEAALQRGEFKLLFVSPERLLTSWFQNLARRMKVRSFAVDEAHCISHWGHDFRPEYRQMSQLRDLFPEAAIHAFTATATPRVREDIALQLRLRDPRLLVGTFDRPNLVYRVLPKEDAHLQTFQTLSRHRGAASIVYCISRNDTEQMAAWLRSKGLSAAPYHAGLTAEVRRSTQEKFANEQLDVVVATVAFGMGIDRSDVRCVLHAALPKSVEHYQQESGRAGRDGLEAECVLLYSASDAIKWERLLERSGAEAGVDPELLASQRALIAQVQRFASSASCRHKALSEYFGQSYDKPNCGACDYCLAEVQGLGDATVTAQKILSCVARVGESFGVGHVVDVLLGGDTERVRQFGHQSLSTYGLLKDQPRKTLQAMVYQLLDQEVLSRTSDDRQVLRLNAASWEVMRGQRQVQFYFAKKVKTKTTRAETDAWQGVDESLAQVLRAWRRAHAARRGVPPYVVFDDRSLRDLARRRPATVEELAGVFGFGPRRVEQVGQEVLGLIRQHAAAAPP